MFAVLALDIEPFPLSHCRAPNLFQKRCARWAGAVCVFIVGVQHIAMTEFSFPALNGRRFLDNLVFGFEDQDWLV